MGIDKMGSLERALGALPVFPLPDVTLFPGVPMGLHIFEPRYRAMLKECLATHGAMALARIVPGAQGEHPEISTVAGAGIVVKHELAEDGRANIVLVGNARVRLDELPFEPPYRRARATILNDLDRAVPESDKAALFSAATRLMSQVREKDRSFELRLPTDVTAAHLADVLAHQWVVDGDVRQSLLECLDPRERVRRVVGELMVQSSFFLAKETSPKTVLN